MRVKMTFTIPEEIAHKLKDIVADRQRSAFVADALREKLREAEKKAFEQELIQGYIETREEDRLINEEWEAATLEGWPDY
jgi:metal-responsive CopG/Arc/MetJ family transcriptional regulator